MNSENKINKIKHILFDSFEEISGLEGKIEKDPILSLMKEQIDLIHRLYIARLKTENEKRWKHYENEIDMNLTVLELSDYEGKKGIDFLFETLKGKIEICEYIKNRLNKLKGIEDFYA